MGFVKLPNLPKGRVSRVIIGERYAPLLRPALESNGVKVISCPNNTAVDERVAYHADLSVLHLGGARLLVSSSAADERFLDELREIGTDIEVCGAPYGREYPDDCALCAAIVGERIYHNRAVSVLADDPRLIPVRQGYAKCAVCAVTDNAAITSDAGMAKAMTTHGVDVLTVSSGHIRLDGFDTGFIGGSAFKLSEDTLAFTGSLDGHPDKERIIAFLKHHGVRPLFLTEEPVFDIGSGIPITE